MIAAIAPLRLLRRGLDRLRGGPRRLTLRPRGTPRGTVLFCADHGALAAAATGEVAEMTRAWVDLAYQVEVLDDPARSFVPTRAYAYVVDTRGDLAWLGPLLPHGTVRVRHLTDGAAVALAGADCATVAGGAAGTAAAGKPTFELPAVTDPVSREAFGRAYRDVLLRIHREVRAGACTRT